MVMGTIGTIAIAGGLTVLASSVIFWGYALIRRKLAPEGLRLVLTGGGTGGLETGVLGHGNFLSAGRGADARGSSGGWQGGKAGAA